MGCVRAEITMSLDGFVAAPGVSQEHPLGVGGEPLHDWLFQGAPDPDGPDRRVADEFFALTGAFILGRRTFDLGEGPWGEDGAFGRPCFVLTTRARETLVRGPTSFTFVTGGAASALAQAQVATGERDVCVMGGAATIQEFLRLGLLDELHIHIAPMLLGGGTRLFEGAGLVAATLERTWALESPYATHLRFAVRKGLSS
jgi:dihydrofolate reductase